MKNSRTKRSNASILKQKITNYIKSHYTSGSPNYSLWYVGITNDTGRRNSEHKRDKLVKNWFSINAGSVDAAREVESYFALVKNTYNSHLPGNISSQSKFVYVFKFSQKQNGLNGFTSFEELLDELFS